jgi:Tfp pilus assembly PilM family ATPase
MPFPGRRRPVCLPVGVHVSADGVRLVQLRAAGAAGAAPRLEVAAVAHAAGRPPGLRRLLRSGGFTGTEVVTNLPADQVHVRTFRLPAQAPAERDAAALRHAREGCPFGDAQPAHVDVVSVGAARQGRDERHEYIAFAAREADIRALVESFGGGVTARSVQAEPLAVYRAAAGAAPSVGPAAVHCAVHVGENETLVLVGEGPALRVLRRVEVGARHLDRAASRKLGVPAAEARLLRRRHATVGAGADPLRSAFADATRALLEAVAREAALCARYHAVTFRRELPPSVRLLGLESSNAQLRSLLHEATGLPVDDRSVFDGIGGTIPADDGAWAAAVGLAIPAAPVRDAPTAGATTESADCPSLV